MADGENPFAPRTPKEKAALDIFERARNRAYSGRLSREEQEATVAELEKMAASASDYLERARLQSKADVLSDIQDIVAMDRTYAALADARLLAQAEAVYAQAGRESSDPGEFRHRLKQGMEKLRELHDRSTRPAERYAIAELAGSLARTMEALAITDPEE
jgi:hypothetical protein